MKKIIPALLDFSKEKFESNLEQLSFAQHLHIDIMDGNFVNTVSQGIKDMGKVKEFPGIYFEAHLMVEDPVSYLEELKKLGIQKVLVHKEVLRDEEKSIFFIEKVHSFQMLCFYVLNPETPAESLSSKELKLLDGVMLMSVHPGRQGQEFIPEVLEKLEFLREKNPILQFQIDGGITDKTLNYSLDFPLSLFSVGSFISASSKPKEAYKCLNSLLDT